VKAAVRGTTPPGISGEKQAADWVRSTFAEIAPRYDLLNHLLSFNVDRGWRKALLHCLRETLQQPDARILDLCCGTGDVLLDLQSASQSRILGADFCHPMLTAAQEKSRRRGHSAPLLEADALQLPLPDSALDAISIAFGFRNLANYREALNELHRVLKPGGVLAILEFSHPPGLLMRTAYGFYSRYVLPVVGSMVSGSREAYAYLPESIRKFPLPGELKDMMSETGFRETSYQLLTGGIAALHSGTKSAGDTR
jgi:demethylmenaquinone methyltransferase/2-methoxy-6-polyprenyl-1,4-benzoquinol methylase